MPQSQEPLPLSPQKVDNKMIQAFEFNNLGPLEQVAAKDLGQINLIIGPNSSGKTWLMKALYAAVRTLEESGRGDDRRSASEVLSEKLYWTFQPDKLGDLVTKGKSKKLSASVTLKDLPPVTFGFGPDTTKQVDVDITERRSANSIFLPPKEVLSLDKIIFQTAYQDRVFGFDSTYSDLVVALQKQMPADKSNSTLSQTSQQLESMFDGGRIEYDRQRSEWFYKHKKARYSINATAEGVKKIGILDTLIRNGFLTENSIVFIDEPESALHPTAITKLFNIIDALARLGVQFFIASHSYFVVKKLYIMAQREEMQIPVLICTGGQWQQTSLNEGMPDNEIINESIRLFEQEIGVA